VTESRADSYGDALTRPFWEGAEKRELLIQHCLQCGHHQFYPRPICLACNSADIEWVSAAGTGTVYSKTTVWVEVIADLVPPYIVGIVELDEGPRMTSNLLPGQCEIGQRVKVAWREREGLPPLPVFEAVGPG
jgi:uncharacterized protein